MTEAIRSGHLNTLPQKILREAFFPVPEPKTQLRRQAPGLVWDALASSHKILQLQPEFLRTLMAVKDPAADNRTFLHVVAERGKLHEIDGLVTDDMMTVKDARGRSPVHAACEFRNIGNMPTRFLSEQNISVPDETGKSPLFLLVSSGNIGIAESLKYLGDAITPAALKVMDINGETPMHYMSYYLNYLPNGAITLDGLMVEDNLGNTPLSTFASIADHTNIALDPLLGMGIPEPYRAAFGKEWCDQDDLVTAGRNGLNLDNSAGLDLF